MPQKTLQREAASYLIAYESLFNWAVLSWAHTKSGAEDYPQLAALKTELEQAKEGKPCNITVFENAFKGKLFTAITYDASKVRGIDLKVIKNAEQALRTLVKGIKANEILTPKSPIGNDIEIHYKPVKEAAVKALAILQQSNAISCYGRNMGSSIKLVDFLTAFIHALAKLPPSAVSILPEAKKSLGGFTDKQEELLNDPAHCQFYLKLVKAELTKNGLSALVLKPLNDFIEQYEKHFLPAYGGFQNQIPDASDFLQGKLPQGRGMVATV